MCKKILPFLLFIVSFQIVKAQNEFITVWKPSLPSVPPSTNYSGILYSSTANQIWFPVRGANFDIHWEEIGYPSHNATITGVYSDYHVLIDFGAPYNPNPSEATYRIEVSNGDGSFQQIRFADAELFIGGFIAGTVGDIFKILRIEHWGNTQWSSMRQAFQGCRALDITATDIPDLSDVTDMSNMFYDCNNLIGNPSFNNWDISNVTNLAGTFTSCYVFNQPIGNWNTSNVTEMGVMFMIAKAFNQPIGNWNTSKVTSTISMFFNASEFNQPIGNWDMSNNLNAELMFGYAGKFNQPIGNWNTSKIVKMNSMFHAAKSFNQDIGGWNTGNVELMQSMFALTDEFNKDISNWNVGKVYKMDNMFNGAKKFNQDIGKWNVGLVANMAGMFNNAIAFNQSLGNWNLSSLQIANDILKNTALSCQNYDNTLFGWSINPSTPNNINISNAPLVYSHPGAVTARDFLINIKNWTIIGDTYNAQCESQLGTSNTILNNETRVYPNPATDILYIKNSRAEKYTILDPTGRTVLKGTLVDERINIQHLASGSYILQLHAKDNVQSLKFIKK